MQQPEYLKIKDTKGSWADLSRWLVMGGAATDSRWFYRDASAETWQGAIKDRLPFVEKITDYFNLEVTRGASASTIHTYFSDVNQFMKWVDKNNIVLSANRKDLETVFLAYDEYLYTRGWIKKEVSYITVYSSVFNIAQSFSKMLNLPPHAHFRYLSRVVKAYKSPRKSSISRAAEKQHLGNTRTLGYYCVDIADAITIEAAYGQLPITVNTLKPDGSKKAIKMPLGLSNLLKHELKQTSNRAAALCKPTDTMDKFRGNLVRVRLLAELVIFVYQTGMNVSQVLQVERKGLSYKLQGNNDWLVTCRKGRKQGPVKFKIYKEYRDRLKNFIKFLDHFYPEEAQLFPVSYKSSSNRGSVNYDALKKQAVRDGIPWIPPRITRNTRANSLDRMVGDPDLSAEMTQHVKETFRKNYERPSQHRSMTALTHFWNGKPVSLINSGCDGQSSSTKDKPSAVINPNCINESGCLWCKSHRDIESEDYVWSLASFKHLKLIEAAQPINRQIPADFVIERLSEKLEAYKELNEQSQQWVDEALMRIEESDYHPTWKNIINFWESR